MHNVMLLASALHTGGAERVIAHLVRHLDRTRFKVTVCHLMNRGIIGEELLRDGFDVVGVDRERRPILRYLSFRALNRIIRNRNIDLIHTHTHYALSDSSLSRLTNRRAIKLVHTFHYGNYPHVARRYLFLEWAGARVADRRIAVGIEQAAAIRAALGFGEGDIDVILNGAEQGTTPLDQQWQRRLQQTGAVVIGTICTFIEQKGLPDLLRVAAMLRSRNANARFVVVGDGPMRSPIEAQCRALGLSDYVFFTGLVPGASSTMLPLFDVFFQPSLWEAMSMVVIEAMAGGKPVVATDVGDNRHVVVDGVNGRIVPRGDISAMAAALDELIASPARRQAFGEAGRRRYLEHYTVGSMARAYERLYLDVLKS